MDPKIIEQIDYWTKGDGAAYIAKERAKIDDKKQNTQGAVIFNKKKELQHWKRIIEKMNNDIPLLEAKQLARPEPSVCIDEQIKFAKNLLREATETFTKISLL